MELAGKRCPTTQRSPRRSFGSGCIYDAVSPAFKGWLYYMKMKMKMEAVDVDVGWVKIQDVILFSATLKRRGKVWAKRKAKSAVKRRTPEFGRGPAYF